MVTRKSCLAFAAFTMIMLSGLPVFSNPVSNSGDNHTITWYRAFFPPVTIPEGPDAGTGFFDRVTQVLTGQMPGYEHDHETANFKRIITELKKEKNICCPSLYKTAAREKYIAFSIPAMVVLPNVVITRKAHHLKFLPYLEKDKKINLSRLLQDNKLTLGISNGRKYSGGIDEILAHSTGSANIVVRSGDDVFKGLLRMLLAGRVDYILGYPIEAKYFLRDTAQLDEIQIYVIAENKISFTIGHVGCPKTEWGKKVIQLIDTVLKDHRQTEEFLGFYEHWLDDETKIYYRQIVQQFFENETDR